jgi:hypothetical protein
MSQLLHDRVQQCIESLLKQQGTVAESSEHSLLSRIEWQWTRGRLSETIDSLTLWDKEIEQGETTNDPKILNIAQGLLGQLSERIATIESVLNTDSQRVSLAPEEKYFQVPQHSKWTRPADYPYAGRLKLLASKKPSKRFGRQSNRFRLCLNSFPVAMQGKLHYNMTSHERDLSRENCKNTLPIA